MGSPFFVVFIFLITLEFSQVMGSPNCGPIVAGDTDRIQFALNLEFLEAEFFLNGALGTGLDSIAPSYADGGPPPVGSKKANLDPLVARIIEEVGHVRSSRKNIFLFQFIYFIMVTSFFLNLSNHLIFELRFLGIRNRIRAENE
jgi:hypothetical protein